jgi:hypothetical protein
MRSLSIRSKLAGAAGLALLCMLGFYSLLSAAPPGSPPFEDAVTQREQMIQELREIRALIKEQNALLKEVIAPPNARSKAKK